MRSLTACLWLVLRHFSPRLWRHPQARKLGLKDAREWELWRLGCTDTSLSLLPLRPHDVYELTVRARLAEAPAPSLFTSTRSSALRPPFSYLQSVLFTAPSPPPHGRGGTGGTSFLGLGRTISERDGGRGAEEAASVPTKTSFCGKRDHPTGGGGVGWVRWEEKQSGGRREEERNEEGTPTLAHEEGARTRRRGCCRRGAAAARAPFFVDDGGRTVTLVRRR